MGSRSGQNALGLKGSVAFTSAGIVLVRREHLEVAVVQGTRIATSRQAMFLGDRRSWKPSLRWFAQSKWQFRGHIMKGTAIQSVASKLGMTAETLRH